VSNYASPYAPFKYNPFFFAYFLNLDRCHFGSHLSGSGSFPGFLISKFLGYLMCFFLFLGMNISAPPLISYVTSFVFFSLFFSGIPSSINLFNSSSSSTLLFPIFYEIFTASPILVSANAFKYLLTTYLSLE
jgi:hypothetical protein